jgi:hypothetical protein
MVAARRIIASSVDADQRRALIEISRSRTEPANHVERAGIGATSPLRRVPAKVPSPSDLPTSLSSGATGGLLSSRPMPG